MGDLGDRLLPPAGQLHRPAAELRRVGCRHLELLSEAILASEQVSGKPGQAPASWRGSRPKPSRLPSDGRSTAAGHGMHGATDPAAAKVARYGDFMRTVGVDLSAEARGTGIAVIDWDAGCGRLNEVGVGADDAVVLAALDNADRAAIDCPLGWPEPFVDFLIAHRAGRAPAPTGQSGLEWRRELSRRATDLHVAETVPGCVPLAVSADRIAAVAMRATGLLAALADAGRAAAAPPASWGRTQLGAARAAAMNAVLRQSEGATPA